VPRKCETAGNMVLFFYISFQIMYIIYPVAMCQCGRMIDCLLHDILIELYTKAKCWKNNTDSVSIT
jgi:hypothetical protein